MFFERCWPSTTLVIGEVILAELRRVLSTKFKIPAGRIAIIESVFAPFPTIPKPLAPSELAILDEADRWIVATAIAGSADVLVTGDADLLAVKDDSPVRILEPRAFWKLLRASGG
jgi:predicted nucleic acid-binding protein